jgi:hypothetical protein
MASGPILIWLFVIWGLIAALVIFFAYRVIRDWFL